MNRLSVVAALGALTALAGCVEPDLTGPAKPATPAVVVVPPAPQPPAVVRTKGPVVVDASGFGTAAKVPATAVVPGAVVVPAPAGTSGVVVVQP